MYRTLAHIFHSYMHAKLTLSSLDELWPRVRIMAVFCTLLAVTVHEEDIAFCKAYSCFLPFISTIPPLRMFIDASLSFCIALPDVPSPRPGSSARLRAVQLRQFSDVLFSCALPSAVISTRSFLWHNGQPLLVLRFQAFLVKKCLFAARRNSVLIL